MPANTERPCQNDTDSRRRGLLWWMPPSFASFIYTVLLKPPALRALAQKVICLCIPGQVRIKGVNLTLNRSDAIVSGNLALGCYETYNLDLFESLLKPGMCVFDIGANIGLYSAIAASHVGPTGQVVAVEPDEVNCSFIRKTVETNSFKNIEIVQKAAGDRSGPANLYLCETNKADHRVYDSSGLRIRVPIQMTTLDLLMNELQIESVDILKIDTQGSEPLVFDGMQILLQKSPGVKILMEFWPWGIRQAGGDPRQFLNRFVDGGFTVFEIDSDHRCLNRLNDPGSLANRDLERQHSNLYLERSPLEPDPAQTGGRLSGDSSCNQ